VGVHGPGEASTVPEAIDVKDELETIEQLLQQIEDARKNAKVALIDMDALGQLIDRASSTRSAAFKRQVEALIEQMAARAGAGAEGPAATSSRRRRCGSSKASSSRRYSPRSIPHGPAAIRVNVTGDGAVEMVPTRPYEFGDSGGPYGHSRLARERDAAAGCASQGGAVALRLQPRDIEVHRTRNTPTCATTVVLDMSGSMRYGGMYVNVKRMALALQGLVQKEFPGDYLQFIEMYSFARPRPLGEIATLLPKPVTIFDSVVRLRADMADPRFRKPTSRPTSPTSSTRWLLSRQYLARQDTPNKQVIVITDGLPTAQLRGENNSICSIRRIRGRKKPRFVRPTPAVATASR